MTSTALEAAPTRVRSVWLVPALAVLVSLVVAWWASVPYLVGVFKDDGIYVLLGKAIASGQGFHYTQLPGAPAATHYPPIYPLVLAALWRVAPGFPENISVMLGFNVLCIGMATLGLYWFLRERFAWRQEGAALTALAAMLSVPVLTLGGALLSEPLFLAALFPALVVGERVVERGTDRSATVAGMALGLLMLERTHAVALLGAVVLLLARRKEWRRLGLFVGAAILVQLPWNLWARSAPLVAPPLRGAYGSYAGWFADGLRAGGIPMLLRTIQVNLRELWLLLGDRVLPGLPHPFGVIALAIVLALLAIGAARAVRRAPVSLLFLVLYLAIVLIIAGTPWRYVWAAWPLYVALGVLGADSVLARLPSRAWRIAALAIFAIPAAAMLRTDGRGYLRREWEIPSRNATAQAAGVVEWVRRNTAPGDVVLAECEPVVSLFTGRQAAPPADFTAMEYLVRRSPTDDRDALRAMLAVVPARYVVSLAPQVQRAARTMTDARPALRELPGYPGMAVFEVVR
jgi:hypothetical protein